MLPYPAMPIVLVGSSSGLPIYPPKWAGSIAWSPSSSQPSAWNTTMKAGDLAIVDCGNNAANGAALIAALTVGNVYVSCKEEGPYNALTQDDINQAGNLGVLDAAYQTRDGAVVEWLILSDEQMTGTTAQRISTLTTLASTVHTYARANGAPAFKILYAPTIVFLVNNIAANPQLATLFDGVLIQAQTYADQPNGADPSYISQTNTAVQLVRTASPSAAIVIQDQVYSKANPSIIYTPAKTEADMNITGYLWKPTSIAISSSDASDQTDATNALNAVLAYYNR